MAFQPKKQASGGGDFENFNLPVPKSGSRKARVSLIVDLGEQNREDYEEADGTTRPQKPCQQVAIFADLVADMVDYGGALGVQQYRLLLNKTFQNVTVGVNFQAVPPKDGNGKIIDGEWTLHPASVLTKVAKATGQTDVIKTLDIEQLLNQPFMADVEVKETEAKNSKTDKDGNVIIYKNVNFKGAAKVPMIEDDDGNEAPMKIAALKNPARCVTFDNAKIDDIPFIRKNLIKVIKLANDYAGSQMQKAIEAYEAANGGVKPEEEKPEPKKEASKAAAQPKKPNKPATAVEDDVDGAPF